MSSILKALKKLEDEKAARQGTKVDITRDIFGAARQPETNRRWLSAVAAVACVVVLAGGGYLFLVRSGTLLTHGDTVAVEPVPPSIPVEPVPRGTMVGDPLAGRGGAPVTAVPQPVAVPAPSPVVATRPAARVDRPRTSVAAPAASHAVPVRVAAKTTPVAPPAIAASRPVISAPHLAPRQAVTPAQTPGVAPSPASSLPTVMVSGIAYNKEPTERVAMINGTAVGEGKSVSGVKVEEIMADRVRFSYGGKNFEVAVGRSNQ